MNGENYIVCNNNEVNGGIIINSKPRKTIINNKLL
jgi:hypothetical protein